MPLNRRQIKVINQNMNTTALLGSLGVDIYRLPQTLRCPFHDDTSKSAKVFPDGHIYCWTEQRMYGAYDLLKLMGVSDNQMLRLLSEMKLTEEEDTQPFVADIVASKQLRTEFRLGRLNFSEYVERIYELYGKWKKQG